MIEWETHKRAAVEYSRIRPRLVSATIAPIAGQRQQALPTDVIAVIACSYGEETDLLDALQTTEAAPGWAADDVTLYLTPAPTSAAPVTITYYGLHLADEESLSFPTIPAAHRHFVDDLEQALVLELAADDANQGPLSYSIGQTAVDRSAGPVEMRLRATQLRERVSQALGGPLGAWA